MTLRLVPLVMLCALTLTSCAHGLPATISQTSRTIAAKGDGYDAPIVLNDFSTKKEYAFLDPGYRPFEPINFRVVSIDNGRNQVAELWSQEKTSRTVLGTYNFAVPGEWTPERRPSAARIRFRWNVNASQTATPAIYAMVVFSVPPIMTGRGTQYIGYAWTSNEYRVGERLHLRMGDDSDYGPWADILVLHTTAGLESKPRNQASLEYLYKTAVWETRDLATDFDTLGHPGLDRIRGFLGYGIGARIPAGTSTQVLIDDLSLQLKYDK